MTILSSGSTYTLTIPAGNALVTLDLSGTSTVTGVTREDASRWHGTGAKACNPVATATAITISTTGQVDYRFVAGDATPSSEAFKYNPVTFDSTSADAAAVAAAGTIKLRRLFADLQARYQRARNNNCRTKTALLASGRTTITGNLTGATSATLSGALSTGDGTYLMRFDGGTFKTVTVTGTAVTWSGAVTTSGTYGAMVSWYQLSATGAPTVQVSTSFIAQANNQNATAGTLYSGGNISVRGGNRSGTTSVGIQSTSVANNLTGGRFETIHTGRFFQWQSGANNTGYSVIIDDQLLWSTPLVASASTLVVQLDFGASVSLGKRRLISIPLSMDQTIASVWWDATGTLTAPPSSPRILWVSDSIGASWYQDATEYALGDTGRLWRANEVFTRLLCDYLGVPDIWPSALAGTGYINAGSYQKLQDRIAADIVLNAPDLVVLHYSTANDSGDTTAAVLLALQTIRASLPTTPIVVFDGIARASYLARAQYVMTAAAQFSATDTYTFLARQMTRTPPLVAGSGFEGSTTGSGQGDWFFGADNTHPTLAGHVSEAVDSADALMSVLAAAVV